MFIISYHVIMKCQLDTFKMYFKWPRGLSALKQDRVLMEAQTVCKDVFNILFTSIPWLFSSLLVCLTLFDTYLSRGILILNICTFPCRMTSTWTNLWLIAESVSSWRRCVKIWSNITDFSKQPWSSLSIKTMQISSTCPQISWVFVFLEHHTAFSVEFLCLQTLCAYVLF